METIVEINSQALFFRILIAHLLADFMLQRKSWVESRQEGHFKSPQLYFHVLIVGILTYLFSGLYNNFVVPLLVMATHFLIDLLKSYTNNSLKYFIMDQVLHLVVLVIAWHLYLNTHIQLRPEIIGTFNRPSFLVVFAAYLFVMNPAGFLISKMTETWQSAIGPGQGLKDAGRWIGIAERVLILTFVLINQITGIGFLIAAKSILRFGDIKNAENRKNAEFILIGTMISFALALLTGLAVRLYLKG